MYTATTLEFRKAVRTAAAHLGAVVYNSWTDRNYLKKTAPKRYVGFHLHSAVAGAVAQLAEQLLNSQGLTAHTRVGRCSRGMVRGTCYLA